MQKELSFPYLNYMIREIAYITDLYKKSKSNLWLSLEDRAPIRTLSDRKGGGGVYSLPPLSQKLL